MVQMVNPVLMVRMVTPVSLVLMAWMVSQVQLDPEHSNTHTHLYEHSSPSPFVRSPPPTKPFLANYKLYVYAEACFPCSFSTVGTLPQPLNAGPEGAAGPAGPAGPEGPKGSPGVSTLTNTHGVTTYYTHYTAHMYTLPSQTLI